ncbi:MULTISPECIES: lysine exporter LysO family protein [Psychrobacter]|uniref:Membrane protein n=1 Tax=Psychrobacter alimentarius TaxID=261164 RepID=A0ABM5ZWC6_9GAMM|nr:MULTISPECIES: lysine exporter LysO family protein [Psychrobacter]AMT96320.1 membrane protein [Psychrobacter alimentarius]QCB31281.1 lysine exporter LysO family protein [Psychrobacter sp. PAMC27889]
MHSLITLVLVLMPMFIGFAIPSNPTMTKFADKGLSYLVFVILGLIGIELSQVEGLGSQIGEIALYVTVLSILTVGTGLFALMLFDHMRPWHAKKPSIKSKAHRVSIRGSLAQVFCVAIGMIIGYLLPADYMPPENTMTVLLMILILLVGIGLKGSGITLKEVLLNRRGVEMSIIFTLSVLVGGLIFALLFTDVSWAKGLALASGFGWYSLSAIVMTDAYGAVWGSVALFNDLVREFFALLFIPVFMRKYPSAAVGLGGATSLDFTLPIIQQSGGLKVVPLAISFGFIINIVSPVLMVFFSALG